MSRTNFFKKYSKTYLILIAGFIFFVGLFSTTSAEAAWLTGWANRRAITIDNTAGSALTNYQIPLDTTNSIYNESGLIGSWHFNEGSGTGAQDSSGNYNYGTLVNSPTWTAAGSCKFGNCLSFDGWDDYVSVPDSSLWNLKDDFSISMWVRHTGVGQAYISQGQNDANSWQLLVGGGGNLRFVVYSGGGIVLNYELSNEGQNDGFWHLVTYVHTSSAHYMYVDGVYRAPNVDQTIGNPTYDFSGPLYFGRTPWTSPYYLNGSLDEIRIYNRALSVSEISDLYNGTKARLDYGDLRFTNEDGSTLIDHWQESDKKSWVEVPSISAASQKTIYMYYGKSDATSVSSGANTFLLYDNFDTFDTGKWSYANGTPTASNSILSIPSNGVLSSINTYGTNTSITWRASLVPTAYGIIGYANVAANTYEAHYANYPTSSIFNAINRNGNTSSQVTGNIGAFTGYNLFTVKRNASTDARFNINNGAETTLSSYLVTSSLSAHIWGQSQTVTADWVFVRNYNVNEPTASIYAEQQNLTYSLRRAITIDNTSGNSLYDYQIPIDLTNSIYNNAGLVGSWHLNDGYGIYAYDSSGDHQMGTWSGTSSYWTSDAKAGTGGTFNGSDTGLSAGTWFNHQQFTISLWVKPGTTQQAYADLFDNNHSGTQNFVFQQNATSVNQYMFATLHPSGTCQTSYFNLTASTWQYVTAVRDARSVKVYINGVETASGTASCQLPVNYVSTNLYFGRHATLGRYWNGQMDEIRAYSRALSSSEISDLYNASKTKLDYSDLRFSDNTLYNDQNWTTSYSYWLESDKKAWVKIPSVAASTQKTIYMYYGNANATNQSNISNTFIFGDDFENGVIDDEKWPVKDLTGFSELGGYLNGSNTTGYLHSNIAFTGNYIQEVLHKRISQTGNGYMSTGFWGSTSNGYGTLLHPTNLWYNRSDGTWNNGTAIYTSDDWVRTKTVAIGSGSYTQVGGLINFTHAYSNSGLSAEYVRLGRRYDSDAYNNQGYSGKWDWVFVRKYTSVEPTTSIYAEQQNLTYSLRRAITIDNTVNASTLYDYQVPVDISTTIYDKRGLFSSWHMDEFSGIVMGDSSGNGYNGTFANNLMWTSGKYGGGLYFNSNSVALGTYDVSPQGAPFSVFAWVKTTQSNSGTVCGSAGSIFSKRTGTNTFCLGVGGTTNANSVGVANWSGTGDVVGTVTINDNNWHYVGFSWNGSVVSLYIDGILNKTQAISFGTQSIANGNSLGAFDSGTARPYVGSLDEVETYSRILSPLEINERYNASKTKLNYGDIRFSDSTSYNDQNWTTSYSYWLESDKKAWVKIPSIAASTQKTIYMYYGNATATGPSPLGKSVNGTITYTDSSGLNPRSSPSYAGGYTVHTFTSGTSVFSPNLPRNADVLVVGGGGGGGTPGANYCGGGGAGGLIYKQSHLIDSGFGYLIEIGSGGAAATNGNNSIFGGLTAYGGGAGYCAAYYSPGIAGGSGGGGTPTNSVGGAAYVGQGNIGGNSSSANPGGSDSGAGGGGGAGGKGNHIGSFPFTNSPAEGGQGLNISISGVASWYAAGGTGSGWYPNAGANGIGGSVYGGHRDGTANTGSGGGGSEVYHVGGVGGSGGSGIVIVRYKTPTVTEPTTSVYSEQNNVTFANQVSISIDNTSGGVLYDYQIPVDLTSAVYDNTGLVGSWHLDEVVGVSTPDSSGNFNNGTLVNGPTWMPVSSCKYGSCLGFNGSSNYVDILNSTLFDVANVTMSAWVYSSNFTQNGFIFEKGSVNSQYACFFESGYITFRTVNSSSVSDDLDVSVSVISNGNWHHLACVYDGSTKKIYVDGSEVGSKSYTQTLRTGQSGQRIGAYGGGTPSYYFNGRIDEVRVYNRGLSASEITALYSASSMKPNLSDIRFSDTDDYNDQDWTHSYSYWLESDKKAWVKVPSIAAATEKTIYMYYGNSSASNQSNGTNTFNFFEDFSSDLSRWTVRGGMSIINNELDMPANTSTDGYPTFSNTYFGTSYIYDFKLKAISGTRLQPVPVYLADAGSTNIVRYISDLGSNTMYESHIWGTNTALGYNGGVNNTYWHTWSIIRKPTSVTLRVDGNPIGGEIAISAGYNTNSRIGISGYNTAGRWDDIRIRKYTATEPTITFVALAIDCGVRAYDGTEIIAFGCEPSGTLTSALRIYDGSTIYGIKLVETTDPNASSFRVQTSSGLKAIMKTTADATPSFSATGGTITYTDSSGLNPRSSPPYTGGYTVHTFTSSGTFTPSGSGNVEVLVVGGGGGGGGAGGGGGGGVIYDTSYAVSPSPISVTVGSGGSGATSGVATVGGNGQNSVFGELAAVGGGGGGGYNGGVGVLGGSGGGGGSCNVTTPGSGTAGQGYGGGTGSATCNPYTSGGGGGASSVGGSAVGLVSGNGGDGILNTIDGYSYYYGGGGGGGAQVTGTTAGNGGLGGGGGGTQLDHGTAGVGGGSARNAGGDGMQTNTYPPCTGGSGGANTGGGGGGMGISVSLGGNGGSGIVIVRYPN